MNVQENGKNGKSQKSVLNFKKYKLEFEGHPQRTQKKKKTISNQNLLTYSVDYFK